MWLMLIILMMLLGLNIGVMIIVNEKEPVTNISKYGAGVVFYEEAYFLGDVLFSNYEEVISSEQYLLLVYFSDVVGVHNDDSAYFMLKGQTDGTVDAGFYSYYGTSGAGPSQIQITEDYRYTYFFRFVAPSYFRFRLYGPDNTKVIDYSRSCPNWAGKTFWPEISIGKRSDLSINLQIVNFRTLFADRSSNFSSENEALNEPFNTVPYNYAAGDYNFQQYELDTVGAWSDV